MEITEVRIKLMEEAGERLRAFCSITFDDSFVIRDLKIIEGTSSLFVAMPSRKLTGRCGGCGCKNHLRAAYCNQCGGRLKDDRAAKDENGRAKLYADIAHPINATSREAIQGKIIEAYHREVDRAQQPGYVSSYVDYEAECDDADLDFQPPHIRSPRPAHNHTERPAAAPRVPERAPANRAPQGTQGPEPTQGPHTPPVLAKPSSSEPHREARRHSGFGAGILD